MQQTIAAEKTSFYGWFVRKIDEITRAHPGDEPKTMEEIKAMVARVGGEATPDVEFSERVIKAAKGTSAGVVKLVQELAPMYDRMALILALPPGQYEKKMESFMKEVYENPNPLISHFHTVFATCRPKEFGVIIKLAMIRAAVEYKLHGHEGLKTVVDPITKGPFEFSRFSLDGVDRGFQLKSAYKARGFEEVLIFVEKNGAPFMLDGKNAGKAVPKPTK